MQRLKPALAYSAARYIFRTVPPGAVRKVTPPNQSADCVLESGAAGNFLLHLQFSLQAFYITIDRGYC